MAAILNSVILDSTILHKKISLVHSDSTWWWQPSWTLPCWIQTLPSWIQTSCYLFSDSLKNSSHSTLTLTQTNSIMTQTNSIWFTWWCSHLELCHHGLSHFAQKKLHSFILTQLDDGSHLEVCHVGFRHCHLWFRHLVIFLSDSLKNTLTPFWLWLKLFQSESNSFISLNLMMASILDSAILLKILTPTNSIWLQLIHSHSTWWWQPSWILPSWNLPSWIQPSYYFLSNSLTLAKIGSHHLHKKNFTDSFWLNLMMATILNSVILDSAILVFTLKLTHPCQDWFPLFAQKRTSLIHSDSSWWWQPCWTLPSWIQTLPSWIQTPCYLLSDSLKNTLSPLWISDSN